MIAIVRDKTRRCLTWVGLLVYALMLAYSCLVLTGCAASSKNEDSSQSEAVPVEHAYTPAVVKGLTSAQLLLQAEAPLAADVDADCIQFDGAFTGFEVQEIERVDDTTLRLTIAQSGESTPSDRPYGYIRICEAAFAEPQEASDSDQAAEGQDQTLSEQDIRQSIALALNEAQATVLPQQGAYDADKHEFVLPVSLGYAQFIGTPAASDFELADTSLTVSSVDYDDPSYAEVTLHIAFPEDVTARDAFDALDATLAKDGITVAAEATNCGQVIIGSEEMRMAEFSGYETTPLACLAAQPIGYVKDTYVIESKTQDEDGETDYDVHLQLRIYATPGTCLLPEDINDAVSVDHLTDGDDGQILGEDVIRIDDSQLFLNIYMPSKIIEALSSDDGEQALQEAQEGLAKLVRAHKVVLEPGVLSNAWGVPEPQTDVALYLADDFDESSDTTTNESASDESSPFKLIQTAYALEPDEEVAATDDPSGVTSDDDVSDDPDNGSGENESGDDNGSGENDPDDDNGSGENEPDDDNGSGENGNSNENEPDNDKKDTNEDEPTEDFDPEEELDSYAESEAANFTVIDDSAEAYSGDDGYEPVDYSSFVVPSEGGNLDDVREAFISMSLIFTSGGAFAAAAHGDPLGYVRGINGVFGFLSEAAGWGEGDLLTFQTVMTKLNSMDTELRSIDRKVEVLADDINKAASQLKYESDLTQLRKILPTVQTYSDTLEEYLWNDKIDWTLNETDDKKGFDAMNSEQQSAVKTFITQVEKLQETYGYNAARDTIDLGSYLVENPTIAAASVVQEYDNCIDTMYNWEPEVYAYRMVYRTYLMYAYLCGYTTAATQIQYAAYTSDDPSEYDEALKKLTENYNAVQETILGKATYTKGEATKIEESPLQMATHAREDGLIKNLVTGKLYGGIFTQVDPRYVEHGCAELICYPTPNDISDFCNRCSSPGDVSTYTLPTDVVSSGQFAIMAGRVANAGYKNLWEEIVSVTGCDIGFAYGNCAVAAGGCVTAWDHPGAFSTEDITASVVPSEEEKADPTLAYRRMIASSCDKTCIHNQRSKRHTYSWTADYYDLVRDTVVQGAEIYRADQHYNAKQVHWSMNIGINYYYTLNEWVDIPDD